MTPKPFLMWPLRRYLRYAGYLMPILMVFLIILSMSGYSPHLKLVPPSTPTPTSHSVISHKLKIFDFPDNYKQYFTINRNYTGINLDFKTLVENKTICSHGSPHVMVLILTFHPQTLLRNAVRSTWGQAVRTNNWAGSPLKHSVNYLFLMGNNSKPDLNIAVEKEAAQYGDILMFSSTEHYLNLTYKVLLGIKWLQNHCKQVQYVIKADEDTFLHIPRLLDKIDNPDWNGKIFGFYVESEGVMSSGKNANNFSVYPFHHFPPHVKGNLYAIPFTIARKLVAVAPYFHYYDIEDALITGVLGKAIGLNQTHYRGFTYLEYTRDHPRKVCDVKNKPIVGTVHTQPDMYFKIWDALNLNKSKPCLL